ncbi:DUF4158 domain-containing protein [Aminobacter sp. SR38]|uniref:DUF4158 domain-containing protein n=1 Tax=Aminobacter sp. SR38 TaxID=2774562 RepID=UPI001FEE9AE1|nr:DUF4158 domain-containing protein [Aminobacter sp. SR38]
MFLEDPGQVPATALRFTGRQLSFSDPERLIAEYVRSEGRWRHALRIRQHYGYRTYTNYGVAFRLNRFLYALCWTGSDRPSALFDRAVAWLLEAGAAGAACLCWKEPWQGFARGRTAGCINC